MVDTLDTEAGLFQEKILLRLIEALHTWLDMLPSIS